MTQKLRYIIFTLIVLSNLPAISQVIVIIPKAGVNFADMVIRDDDDNFTEESSFNPGFHIGATAALAITDEFSIESGLIANTRGFRIITEGQTFNVTTTNMLNLLYVDIPVLGRYTSEIGDDLKVFGNFGPYLGIGVSGEQKLTVEFNGDKTTDTESVSFGNETFNDDLKRLDYGLTIGGGIEWNRILLGASFDLGLANLALIIDDGSRIRNRVLKVSVGYRIGDE